jgi:hypothetical protein
MEDWNPENCFHPSILSTPKNRKLNKEKRK